MRIAVWHDLPSGGGKRALYDHIAGLLDRGHEIESWCTSTADQEFLPLEALVVEHVVPMTVPGLAKRGLSRISNGAIGIFSKLRAIDEHAQRCAEEINRAGFDVLLAGSSRTVAASPIGRYVKVPSVLYLQEPCRSLYEAMPRLPWPALPPGHSSPVSAVQRLRDAIRIRALRVQAREELESARAFDRLLANSYFSRESVLRAYGVDARVCYLGVDTKRYIDHALPRKHLVVGIGALVRPKRVDVAIAAVAALPPPRPVLTWIGNGADERYLRALIDLAKRVDVTFNPLIAVPHSQVVDVLNQASAMIYAPRLEPFGYAPLEAGACGLPVVAKAEGGVRETVVHGVTGLLVPDDEDLGPALSRLFADQSLMRRMSAKARHNVETCWSLDAATERLESHLTAVATRR